MSNETNKTLLVKNAVIVKAVVILVVTLVLCVPIDMIQSVLYERESYRSEAISGITSTWGGPQTIVGPVLVVPYQVKQEPYVTNVGGTAVTTNPPPKRVNAFFLPAELKVDSTIKSEKRYRGIYDAVLYSGNFTISGSFAPPELEKAADENILWDEAWISFSFSDLRGVRDTLQLQLGPNKFVLEPGSALPDFNPGVHARIGSKAKTKESLQFSLQLPLNGSEFISFVPLGQQNTVTAAANWPDPGFEGTLLPTERTISKDGFFSKMAAFSLCHKFSSLMERLRQYFSSHSRTNRWFILRR